MTLESLSAREQIYVDARMNGSPPHAAARIAGYKDPAKQAQTLEADGNIRLAVEYTLRCRSHELEYTRNDIVAGFRDAIACAATATEMIAGWREIAKITGAYAPAQVEHKHSKSDVEQMSDAELADAIEGEFTVLDFEDE